MKAYRLHEFTGPDALRREELPSPSPGPGQVLLKVKAVSLNYRDLLISKGLYNPKIPLPLIPLSDAAGEVAALGPGAGRFQLGDRVMANFMPAWVCGSLDDAKARSALGADVPRRARRGNRHLAGRTCVHPRAPRLRGSGHASLAPG